MRIHFLLGVCLITKVLVGSAGAQTTVPSADVPQLKCRANFTMVDIKHIDAFEETPTVSYPFPLQKAYNDPRTKVMQHLIFNAEYEVWFRAERLPQMGAFAKNKDVVILETLLVRRISKDEIKVLGVNQSLSDEVSTPEELERARSPSETEVTSEMHNTEVWSLALNQGRPISPWELASAGLIADRTPVRARLRCHLD